MLHRRGCRRDWGPGEKMAQPHHLRATTWLESEEDFPRPPVTCVPEDHADDTRALPAGIVSRYQQWWRRGNRDHVNFGRGPKDSVPGRLECRAKVAEKRGGGSGHAPA